MSHYDLGGIRTETAIRSTPPEKKERLGETRGVNQKRLGNSKAPPDITFVIEIQSKPSRFNFKKFNNEFALAN